MKGATDPYAWGSLTTARGVPWRTYGDGLGMVREAPTPRGYVWQAGSFGGCAASLGEAVDWVEAICDTLTIPKQDRWLDLNYLKGLN